MSGRWRNFHIGLITLLFVLLSLSHFHEVIAGIPCIPEFFGLSRHVIERFIYILLIAYTARSLGLKYGSATWLASALAMLPQALVISPNPRDALIETIAALSIGGLSIAFFEGYRVSQRLRKEMEEIAAALKTSQEKYEELFTNASDAIWVHDLNGKIVIANKACEKLAGYPRSELIGKDISQFLSPEALVLAREVEAKVSEGEVIDYCYEQRIIRKGGTEAIVELVTRLIKVNDKPSAFQNTARNVTEERRCRDDLRVQIQKNIMAQEEERKRIARDLHDDIAQSVLLLSRRLDIIMSAPSGELPKVVVGELEQVHSIADEVCKNLQRYARDLRPSIIDQMGLIASLDWLVEELSKELGIKAEVKASKLPSLASEMELVMFRIAQEALNNVRRHADASEVSITMESDASNIKMTIADNGKGFSLSKLTGELAREGKLGVLGMEERARLIGGSLEIKSEPDKGTTIIIEAPV